MTVLNPINLFLVLRLFSLLCATVFISRGDVTEYGLNWTSNAGESHECFKWSRGDIRKATSSIYHSAIIYPGASFANGNSPSGHKKYIFNANLRSVFQSAYDSQYITPRNLEAVEIGNEPDLYFSSDMPDRLAAIQKVVWWAVKRRRSSINVLMPALANCPGPFVEVWLKNNAALYTDAWNVHYYGWPHDFLSSLEIHQAALHSNLLANIPIWVTECGVADMPTNPNRLHLARQQSAFERMIADGTIFGLSKLFIYGSSPSIEGALDFGIFDDSGVPRPSFGGISKMIKLLEHFEVAYKLHSTSSNETVGWIFRSKHQDIWWTMLFSPWRRSDYWLPKSISKTGAQVQFSKTSKHRMHAVFPSGDRPFAVGLDLDKNFTRANNWDIQLDASTNLHFFTKTIGYRIDGVKIKPIASNCRCSEEPLTGKRKSNALGLRSSVIVSVLPINMASDTDSGVYFYRRDKPINLLISIHEFAGKPAKGEMCLKLPAEWKGGGVKRISIGSEQDILTNVVVFPDSFQGLQDNYIELNWNGEDGGKDVVLIKLRDKDIRSRKWVKQSGKWFTGQDDCKLSQDGDILKIKCADYKSTVQLILRFDKGSKIADNDWLRFEIGAEVERVAYRIEWINEERAVYRLGTDRWLSGGNVAIEARFGDFTPAFWSRPSGVGAPSFLRITITSLKVPELLTIKTFVAKSM